MKICIGSDHAGLELKARIKEFLIRLGYVVEDLGAYEYNPDDDYPDFAEKVARKVAAENETKGILFCGSGQGMSIAANKIKGIRAAVCWDKESAKLAREHLNANILCLGARLVELELAEILVKIWLEPTFLNQDRHKRRINKIKEIEENIWSNF